MTRWNSIDTTTTPPRVIERVDPELNKQIVARAIKLLVYQLDLARDHVVNNKPCTGQFESIHGIPCYHSVRQMANHNVTVRKEHFHRHWYFNREGLPLPQPSAPPVASVIFPPGRVITRGRPQNRSTRREWSTFELTAGPPAPPPAPRPGRVGGETSRARSSPAVTPAITPAAIRAATPAEPPAEPPAALLLQLLQQSLSDLSRSSSYSSSHSSSHSSSCSSSHSSSHSKSHSKTHGSSHSRRRRSSNSSSNSSSYRSFTHSSKRRTSRSSKSRLHGREGGRRAQRISNRGKSGLGRPDICIISSSS